MKAANFFLVSLFLYCLGCSSGDDQNTSAPESGVAAESSSDAVADDEMEGVSESNELPDGEGSSNNSQLGEGATGIDAMSLYREAQSQMKEGNRTAAYETAKKAMASFIAEGNDLPWMLLESIDTVNGRIDVHFNMGEKERRLPDDGIIRPLSFRIWSGGEEAQLLQVIDFEIGRFGGKAISAAIGEMTDSGHSNYGVLDVDADYETIRKRVIELVTQE
ncbi:MAG: hypothetical protein AAGG48_25590 [Planctomycetota bacterium]